MANRANPWPERLLRWTWVKVMGQAPPPVALPQMPTQHPASEPPLAAAQGTAAPAQIAAPVIAPGHSWRERLAARTSSPAQLGHVVGDCAIYEDGKRRTGRLPLAQAARAAAATTGFVWIGIRQPSVADIDAIAEEFALPPLAVEDAVKAHQRPKLEVYDDILFAILKPVQYLNHDEVVELSELAIFVGPTFVVSVRHGISEVLHTVREEYDAGVPPVIAGPLGVLYRAADLAVDQYEAAIEHINDDVDAIETAVFGDQEVDYSQRIYMLKREIAEFRRAAQPLVSVVEALMRPGIPGVLPDAVPYFRDLHDHALRVAEAVEAHDRLLTDVLSANLSRVAARQSEIAVRQNEIAVRQNEDMRKISAWAAMGLVPTAIAGIYGMNFEYMPELRWHYGYFVTLGVIATVCLALYREFRRNGWL